jgi:hypothetical protein
MVLIANALEARGAVLAARHRLAVDDPRARAQLGERFDDEREAVRQGLSPGRLYRLDPLAVLAGDHPEAVVLDLHAAISRRPAAAVQTWGGTAR